MAASPAVALLLLLVGPLAGPLEAGLGQAPPLSPQRLALDPASAAQRFDGHGALSAGASSRLLFDYAEPQRSQLLDYLFAPCDPFCRLMNAVVARHRLSTAAAGRRLVA